MEYNGQTYTGLVDTTMGRMIFNRPIPQDLGFVPREMLYGTPEASGIYPIMLEEPIPARSVFLFQRKTQPLSIAAKKLRQMLLEDAPQESGK